MKIMHASIPADNPETAAHVLAEIMSGEAIPFPPGGPLAWMAWSGDGNVEFEVVPRGNLITFGEEQGEWRPQKGSTRLSEVHIALSICIPADEAIAIAQRAGWPARLCDRGGGLFQLTELWVEGAFMIELLDPKQTARYEEVATPESWKRVLAAKDLVLTA